MTNEHDPLDRLGEALGGMPAPDQWNEIVARSEDPASAGPGTARSGSRGGWWVVAAAAATAALIVSGVVVIANRDNGGPAATRGDTLPPPPPSLPCTSESDVAAIASLLDDGQQEPARESDPLDEFPQLMGRNPHVVLVGSVTSVARSNDGYTTLVLDHPKYLHGEGPVGGISIRSEWSDAATTDPLAEPVELAGAMIVAFARSLSSSPVWVADPDALYLGCAGTNVPAVGVRGVVPPFLGGSIDSIANQVTTALASSGPPTAPSSTPPPPTTVAAPSSLPCASDADLDAVRTLLRTGLPTFDDEPADELSDLLDRTDVGFRATLGAASRGAAEKTYLHLTDVDVLAGDDAHITSIDLPGSWVGGQEPDPLATPVIFDGVQLVVFATRVPDLPTEWAADVQGVFVACTAGSSYVRPLLEPAPFLDHSSLDALADQVIVGAAPDSGPWGRPCTDRTGASEPPASDALADRAFGPLAREPGLRILYPMGERVPMYSDPVSSVTRVPGGLLIRLQSTGPDGGDRIVAVVNDDGAVRWRRCIPDSYGWRAVIDDDVVHLEMTADDGTNTTEWWSFDLATGESTVDAVPPADPNSVASEWPPPVFFHSDGSGVQMPLSRRNADGRELWRRDDLFDPGGEGFRASEIQRADLGEVVLVRACVGAPIGASTGPDEMPCPYALLGVDADDGSTIWQIDESFAVSLVADGYAIVAPTSTGSEPVSALLDVATGEFVPGGVSDEPGAFYEECCGGYEYNRVESAGALAWTVAFDRLNVWFPADSPGPGGTVDLLGAPAAPTVTARFGMPVYDVDGCGVNCRHVLATGAGFAPGSTVRAECLTDRDGQWTPLAGSVDVAVSADGSVGISNLCADGRDDGNVKVVIDGVESNALTGG